MLLEEGEALPLRDREAYGNHLVWAHGAKPYFIER
jgi:hypothetical protein